MLHWTRSCSRIVSPVLNCEEESPLWSVPSAAQETWPFLSLGTCFYLRLSILYTTTHRLSSSKPLSDLCWNMKLFLCRGSALHSFFLNFRRFLLTQISRLSKLLLVAAQLSCVSISSPNLAGSLLIVKPVPWSRSLKMTENSVKPEVSDPSNRLPAGLATLMITL